MLYKIPDTLKYRSFEVPKRSGGKRHIKAPEPRLALLQRRLAKLLYNCLQDLKEAAPSRRSLAHGFEQSRSIITNASLHKRRRYVLNIDLEDFFPSINFGRVRGFFIKDQHFALEQKVATVIAQIACHDNELPQGSPCSPVISNLIGHLLDTRLARFAKTYKCTYSRYADDITFSTNRKDFPAELAAPIFGTKGEWQLGAPLVSKIEHSGFKINNKKTRMQVRGSRQTATGLMVNEKVNVRPEYYRTARSMCQEMFSNGSCYRMVPATLRGGPSEIPFVKESMGLSCLTGILNHIYYVKDSSDLRNPFEKKKSQSAIHNLYKKFLFYKNFVAPSAPLILTEGNTDSIYLRAAIRMLPYYHPRLGEFKAEKFVCSLRFMRYSHTVHNILQLGGGTGDLKHLILNYRSEVKNYKHTPFTHPIIIVINNDDGAKDVFSVAKSNVAPLISLTSNDLFYHLAFNLYLVKTPEAGTNQKSCIEDLFEEKLLQTIVGGRKFDPNKKHEAFGKYGKMIFAEKVVRPNATKINFSKFGPLLDRVVAVLDHYESAHRAHVAAAV